MVRKSSDFNEYYNFNKNENNSSKSVTGLNQSKYNFNDINDNNNNNANDVDNNINNGITKIKNGEVKTRCNLKKDITSEDYDEDENSSCTECISNEDNSYYSMSEGYRTNYIMESLFDKNSFVYFMVPFNKYNYTNYYINWNKMSFRVYASLNSIKEKKMRKRKINYNMNNNNLNNPLLSILNNFLYFLLLSEFLNFNEILKLMPLNKCSYEIFNNFFYINVNINPFTQNIKDIIKFLKENKEYQFNILNKKNYKIKNTDNFFDKKELLNGIKEDNSSAKVEVNANNIYNSRQVEIINENNNNTGIIYDNNISTTQKYMLNCDKIKDNIEYYKENDTEGNLSTIKKDSLNNIFFTNNIINMRYLFCLFEFMRIYLSKYNREKLSFCISDHKFKYDINKVNNFFKDIFPYGNKVSSYEYKVKLKKHVHRRWNLKTNYVHENYFHHKSEQPDGIGVLKLIENEQSNLYPSYTSFITLDKLGYINTWKIDGINSIVPTRLFNFKLLLDNKKQIEVTDAINLKPDNFLISDDSSLYHFYIENKKEVKARSIINLSMDNKEETIKNIIRTDNNKCSVGFNKASCYRIDLEKGEIECCKKLNEELQKIKCFDINTNIVLGKKHILIDDKRLSNFVCYINYKLIDYENDKKYFNSDNFFCDIDITGISLTSLNSNNSIYLFDLRYKYPSTCLYYEDVVTETFGSTENYKLKYLNDLKINYNVRHYLNNKKYSGYHDNIILFPYVTDKKEKIKKTQENYVKNKILSDESFIYTIIKEKKKKESDNLPCTYLNMWRWCDKRQCKVFMHYYKNFNCTRNLDHINYHYKNMLFDSVYKLADAPNHLFVTYENSNYIHSLLPPSYGLQIEGSLKEIPFSIHPTNL